MTLSKLTDADFKRDVVNAEGRVVVDFYADWCGPCHQVAPALEELSSKWEGDVRFVKVNIDENPQLARPTASSPFPRSCCSKATRLSLKRWVSDPPTPSNAIWDLPNTTRPESPGCVACSLGSRIKLR